MDGRTDQPTDGQTDKAGCRVACTQLKTMNKKHGKILTRPTPFMGVFLVTNNRVFYGPYSRSLCSFARTAHSNHSLHFTPLTLLARSIHGSCFLNCVKNFSNSGLQKMASLHLLLQCSTTTNGGYCHEGKGC